MSIQSFLLTLGMQQLEAKKGSWKWQNQIFFSRSRRLGQKLFVEAIKTVVEGEKFGVTMQQKFFFFGHFDVC